MPRKPATEKHAYRVYASDANHKKGSVLVKMCHATNPGRCAERYAFRGKPKTTKNAYVWVEERKPGRGENPMTWYKLSRKFVKASPSYKQIAEARGYKNTTTEPKISIDKREKKTPTKAAATSKPKRRASSKGKK